MEKLRNYQSPEARDITLETVSVIASSFKDGGDGILYDNYEEESWV